MKIKFTILELIVVIVFLGIITLFLSPRFLNTPEQLQQARVRANVSIAVSALKGIFALKPDEKMTEIAELVAETLNKTTKNPVGVENVAFTVNTAARGSVSFITDDSKDFIIINGYEKDTQTPLITKIIKNNK